VSRAESEVLNEEINNDPLSPAVIEEVGASNE